MSKARIESGVPVKLHVLLGPVSMFRAELLIIPLYKSSPYCHDQSSKDRVQSERLRAPCEGAYTGVSYHQPPSLVELHHM